MWPAFFIEQYATCCNDEHSVRFRLRIDRLNAALSFILINGKQFGIVRFLFLYLLPL